jgi:hypothetical protein
VSTELVFFTIGQAVLKILVDLVGGDGDQDAELGQRAQGIQDMGNAQDIGGNGVGWVAGVAARYRPTLSF